MNFDDLTTFQMLMAAGSLAALLSMLAALADRKQRRRRNLDRIGIIAWGQVSIAALFLAIIAFAIAIRAYTAGGG